MFIAKDKIHNINLQQLVYNPKLPRQNTDVETLVKLSHTKIPADLPLISTTYSENPQQEKNITILLSNLLLKIRKLQGHKKVPVVFYHEIKSQELLFIYTNFKKYNLINHLEEAIILHQLNKEGYTHKQIASVLGVSRSYITNKVRLTIQPKELIQALINDVITEGHAKILMGITDKVTQLNLLDIIQNENLSVKETAKLVQNFKGYTPLPKKTDPVLVKKLEKLERELKSQNLRYEILIPKRKKEYITKVTVLIKDTNQLDKLLSKLNT